MCECKCVHYRVRPSMVVWMERAELTGRFDPFSRAQRDPLTSAVKTAFWLSLSEFCFFILERTSHGGHRIFTFTVDWPSSCHCGLVEGLRHKLGSLLQNQNFHFITELSDYKRIVCNIVVVFVCEPIYSFNLIQSRRRRKNSSCTCLSLWASLFLFVNFFLI